ncbi:MAG: hypothetical protein KBF21_11940 [Thermoanaerobaculia bacterium]|nr:hypothetical protein [Thermoanaerobaculia bacterium]MBP9824926.1 hypothetical protein [Thermoanaerobaculia bacterium]
MRCRVASLAIAGVLAVVGALADPPAALAARRAGAEKPRHIPMREAPVTITSPLANATLRAGEAVVFSWKALPELRRYAGIEEWEAFLSLDGGVTYPVRLTPHLDLDRRSVVIELPDLATESARFLLRFGDERVEHEFAFPERFEIVPSRTSRFPPWGVAHGRGEPARLSDPNDAGVVIWVEGSRRGEATRTVIAGRTETEIEAVEPLRWIALRHATAAPASPQIAAAEPSNPLFAGPFASTSTHPFAVPRGAAIAPRRRTCRQNE